MLRGLARVQHHRIGGRRKKVDVTNETFRCLTEMTPVLGFFVANVLGRLEDTLKVANSTTGGRYPPGPSFSSSRRKPW